MRTTTARRAIGAATAAAAVMAVMAVQFLMPAPALAGVLPPTGVQTVYATSTTDPQNSKVIAAVCPAGKRVTGGGGGVVGSPAGTIHRMQPVHPDTGSDRFEVAAFESALFTYGNWSVFAYAFCTDPLPGMQIVEASIPPGSENFQSVATQCPIRTAPIGGGGRIGSGMGEVSLDLGSPTASKVAAGGYEPYPVDYIVPWTVTAYAVCASYTRIADIQPVRVQTAFGSPETTIDAHCPAGMSVTGGLAGSGNFPGIRAVVPTGTGIHAEVQPPVGSALYATAYCVA